MHKISRDELLIDALTAVSSTNDLMKHISTVGLTFKHDETALMLWSTIEGDCDALLRRILVEESCSCEHVELFTE